MSPGFQPNPSVQPQETPETAGVPAVRLEQMAPAGCRAGVAATCVPVTSLTGLSHVALTVTDMSKCNASSKGDQRRPSTVCPGHKGGG